MSAFAVLFLLFDASVKVLQLPIAVEATTQLGYTTNLLFWLGLLELACLALYLFPRTGVLGAVLWTGYLGGAIATHVRVGNPLLSQALFPVYVALILWGGSGCATSGCARCCRSARQGDRLPNQECCMRAKTTSPRGASSPYNHR